MQLSRRPAHTALLALAATVVSLWALPVAACGGCFNMTPPPPPKPGEPIISSPVVQDAERVLFLRDEATKVSRVWIEVRYTGLASDFGWVLPVPKLPKVGVGTASLFDHLEYFTKPLYFLKHQGTENCKNPNVGCEPMIYDAIGTQDSSAADVSGDSGGGGGPPAPPKVEVLASGTTGPYDYVVVKGSDAEVLYKWLTDRAYVTPLKAKPILEAHIAKGDVFVAIKLSNGQGVQSIRPITLEMPDAEPCVPLRLTSIAAAEEMSVQVVIAGPGRAVVKNYLDVVVNPFRLKLIDQVGGSEFVGVATQGYYGQEPTNYAQVMAAAIDEAGGRAFVTEASIVPGPKTIFAPGVVSYGGTSLSQLAAATNWSDVATSGFGPWPTNVEMADAVALPGAMTQAFPDTAPLQVIAELRACGSYWQQIASAGGDTFSGPVTQDCVLPSGKVYTKAKLQAMPANGAAMAKAIQTGLVDPMADAWKLLANSARLTRLAMRISPEEMDRDPVFAFNPSLPAVAAQRVIPYSIVCPNGWTNEMQLRLSMDGLGSWVFKGSNPLDPRFLNAPAALTMAVLEETGAAVAIAPSQADLISAAIAGALPGKPSLPADLVIKPAAPWLPPPSDPLVTKLGPWPQPPGCVPKAGYVNGKVPNTAVADPGPDAGGASDGSTVSDINLDSEATSGPVPGIDAAGGWADAGTATDLTDASPTAEKSAPADDGGCSAATGGRSAGWAWIGMFALCFVWVARRRRVG